MSEAEIRTIAKRYFYIGFLLLPWLWLVNFIYIYPVTRRRPDLGKDIQRSKLFTLLNLSIREVSCLRMLINHQKHSDIVFISRIYSLAHYNHSMDVGVSHTADIMGRSGRQAVRNNPKRLLIKVMQLTFARALFVYVNILP